MLNMARNEKEEPYYIIDLQHDGKTITIKYADGSIRVEPFSEHNLEVLRHRLIEQTKSYLGPYLDSLTKNPLSALVKSLILDIVGLYFLYNLNIHVIIKILLTIIIIFGEFCFFIYKSICLAPMSNEIREGLATEYYLKNLDKFFYYDEHDEVDKYFISIEDIGHYGLTMETLQEIIAQIEELKKQGLSNDDIKISFSSKSIPKEDFSPKEEGSSSKKLTYNKIDHNQYEI